MYIKIHVLFIGLGLNLLATPWYAYPRAWSRVKSSAAYPFAEYKIMSLYEFLCPFSNVQ